MYTDLLKSWQLLNSPPIVRRIILLVNADVQCCQWLKLNDQKQEVTRMWANAQRDGRPAEHRWRPLFNAAKFG